MIKYDEMMVCVGVIFLNEQHVRTYLWHHPARRRESVFMFGKPGFSADPPKDGPNS